MKNIVKIIFSCIAVILMFFACMALFACGVTIDTLSQKNSIEVKYEEIKCDYEVSGGSPTSSIEKLIPPATEYER